MEGLENPAYLVKENNKKGIIIGYSKSFKDFTKFTYEELCGIDCYSVFDGVQEQIDGGIVRYVQICGEDCQYRNREIKAEAWLMKNFWIKAKNRYDEVIRHFVDVYIIPFETNNNRFALHLLIDKGRSCRLDKFESIVKKTGGIIPHSIKGG